MKTQTLPRQAKIAEIVSTFWKYAGPTRKLIPLHVFLLSLDGIIQGIVPGMLGYVVDRLLKDPVAFVHRELLPFSCVGMAVVIVFYAIAVTQHTLWQVIGAKTMVSIQTELYAHLQRLDLDFYQRTHVGEITSRLTNDTMTGVMELYSQFQYMFWVLSLLTTSVIIMGFLNTTMLALYGGVLLILLLISLRIFPFMRSLNRQARDDLGKVNARMTENISSMTLIQSFAQEERFSASIRELCDSFLKKTLRSKRVGIYYSDTINTFITLIGPLFMLALGALLIGPKFTVATLVAFFTYWRSSSWHAANVLSQLAQVFSSFASFDRIIEFFKQTPLIEDRPRAQSFDLTGSISFKNVLFAYPADPTKIVLSNFSLTIKPHTSVAIVGESGAGKSTIAHMLLRFMKPQSGQVLLDGVDILDIAQQSLREQVGFVMQDTTILSGSVRENMLIAKSDATDEEISQALENAMALTFVNEMAQGLDTVLGERGVRLSGGQRQRLSIARVFLKNPPIVLFDEATSALDSITEKKIQTTMKKLFQGRTAVIIAHRLSTVLECDTIVYLEKGTSIAAGSHAEIYYTCEQYRALCTRQDIVPPA